jgi:hypothetical protein
VKKSAKKFLIAASFTHNIVLDLINTCDNFYNNPNTLINSMKECLYGITKQIMFGKLNNHLYAHIYFNPSRFLKEKESLIKDINLVKNKIEQKERLTAHERKISDNFLLINIKTIFIILKSIL